MIEKDSHHHLAPLWLKVAARPLKLRLAAHLGLTLVLTSTLLLVKPPAATVHASPAVQTTALTDSLDYGRDSNVFQAAVETTALPNVGEVPLNHNKQAALVRTSALAQPAETWTNVVNEIKTILQQSLNLYVSGKATEAQKLIDEAYYELYEAKGMEAAVRMKISARRAAEEEYAFTATKNLMARGAPVGEVQQVLQKLINSLEADLAQLESKQGKLSDFISSLLIVIREGLEAILILAALMAYLAKTGNKAYINTIYQGTLAALIASGFTAWLLRSAIRVSGASQEVLEGVTLLIAVAVLFLVSFWLLGHAQAQSWQRYIQNKLAGSLSSGSRLAIWSAAFLAVYREGAETVLFYQALISGGANPGRAILGLVLGLVVLLLVFVAARWGSMKLPIRPFFAVTSIFLYYMAFTFAGKGIHELQEGGALSATLLSKFPTIEWLGIYPTWQTLGLQGLLVILAIIAFLISWRSKKQRA